MKYDYSFSVSGCYHVTVEADSPEEALELAKDDFFNNANFGDLEDIALEEEWEL